MNLPTQREELERKVIETLQWVIRQHRDGEFDDSTVLACMQSMFGCVSGLIDTDVVNLLSMENFQ